MEKLHPAQESTPKSFVKKPLVYDSILLDCKLQLRHEFLQQPLNRGFMYICPRLYWLCLLSSCHLRCDCESYNSLSISVANQLVFCHKRHEAYNSFVHLLLHHLCIFVPCSELRLMILYLPIYLQINRWSVALQNGRLMKLKMGRIVMVHIWQIPLRWVGKI